MIYVLVIILLLLSSVLILPVGVELDYSERGRRWRIVWMGFHIPVPAIVKRWAQSLEEKVRKRIHLIPGRRTRTGERRSLSEISQNFVEQMRENVELFRRGIDTLRAMSRHVRIHVHRLDVTVATPDPALTGFSYGMMYAFAGAVSPSLPLRAAVDFTRESPKVDFRVEVKLTLIKIIPAAIRFARFLAATKKQDDYDSGEH